MLPSLAKALRRMRMKVIKPFGRKHLDGLVRVFLCDRNPDVARALATAFRDIEGVEVLEAAVRFRADGCDSTPVGYNEGWYVDEDVRRRGVGRALVEAAEAWARARGCRQMASDAELRNTISHQAHGALGYEETARLVFFKKDVDRAAPHSDRSSRTDDHPSGESQPLIAIDERGW